MEHLQVHNAHLITYKDDIFTIDVLGGVDLTQVERMICTLRIGYKSYPPQRTTIDLYNDAHSDKLIRTLCDKWELKLVEVSKRLHQLITELEEYRLGELRFTGKQKIQPFEVNQEDKKKALQLLKSKNLLAELIQHLNITGVLGEDENAVILILALASYKFSNPFSVLCLAKSGIGKSYILQKLSECMPPGSYSFHTKISANALYYFDSNSIQNKALLIEDLEWTMQMLTPLATLQTQGRLVNTRATKDKDGMLHSTTFEVVANLCLVACAYNDKNLEEMSLPFLCLNLNHSHTQDIAVMEYQKKCKAGQIKTDEVKQSQHLLKCTIAALQNISVINPYATLINLPDEVTYPRKSLLLLLNFIEVVTYFFQYQREQVVDESTGEVFIKTHPTDIEVAFKFLKSSLFRRSDELSTSARGFYNWLDKFLREAKTNKFTSLDIRKAKAIHPRTLNRYLQELKLFSYIQVVGGNKNREGFIYKLTGFGNYTDTQSKIEQSLQATLKKVWNEYNKQTGKEEPKEIQSEEVKPEPITEKINVTPKTTGTKSKPAKRTDRQRVRIEEKEKHTLKLLLEMEEKEPGGKYLAEDFVKITGRHYMTEARHLKTLWEQGTLKREWINRQYHYSLAITSKTVSQTPMSNPENQ